MLKSPRLLTKETCAPVGSCVTSPPLESHWTPPPSFPIPLWVSCPCFLSQLLKNPVLQKMWYPQKECRVSSCWNYELPCRLWGEFGVVGVAPYRCWELLCFPQNFKILSSPPEFVVLPQGTSAHNWQTPPCAKNSPCVTNFVLRCSPAETPK